MPDDEIFDFTDSRFLSPPVANQRNFPEIAVVTDVNGESFVTPTPLLGSPPPRSSHSPTPQPIFQLTSEPDSVTHSPFRYIWFTFYRRGIKSYVSLLLNNTEF